MKSIPNKDRLMRVTVQTHTPRTPKGRQLLEQIRFASPDESRLLEPDEFILESYIIRLPLGSCPIEESQKFANSIGAAFCCFELK